MPKNTNGSATRKNALARDFMAVVFALDMLPLGSHVTKLDIKVMTKGGK